MPLESYNNWNLPFASTFSIEPKDSTVKFPKGNYQLEMDPSAYFSIIFVDTTLYDLSGQ